MDSKPRIAVIGSGNISKFHIAALREFSFDVCSVASRLGSNTVEKFAHQNSIQKIWSCGEELIENSETWDGLLIASSTESILSLLRKAIPLGKPILVEKPVAEKSDDLKSYEKNSPDHVIVGYNRRHYNTVLEARKFVSENKEKIRGHMCLPEAVRTDIADPLINVRSNSVHGIDMLRFIFGDLTILLNEKYCKNDKFFGRHVVLKSDHGSLIDLNMSWNSPSNFSFSADNGSQRIQLEPFETLKFFKGLEKVEPSEEFPIRSYYPQIINQFNVFKDTNKSIKPGFFGQTSDFKKLFGRGQIHNSAVLKDAYEALKLVEEILEI